MATPGQPTLYKPEYGELAHNYCLLGATNEVLGDFFGVTRRTIQNWIATHPEFADAVYRGRAVADATVVRALFERACARPASELEPALWVRQENDRRKGRKGRKLPATIRRFGFVNDLNHLYVYCGGRFAPLGVAETGGNSLQRLCSRTCPQFRCLTQGVHSTTPLAYRLRKLRKPLKSKPASSRLPNKT